MRLRHDAPFRAKRDENCGEKNSAKIPKPTQRLVCVRFIFSPGKVRTLLIRAYLVIAGQFSRDAIVVVVVDIRPKKGRIGFCMRMCLTRSMVREILRKSLFARVILFFRTWSFVVVKKADLAFCKEFYGSVNVSQSITNKFMFICLLLNIENFTWQIENIKFYCPVSHMHLNFL